MLCTWLFVPHEDGAGNPLAAAVALAALLVGLVRWRRLGARRHAALLCALAAWMLSAFMFRDNPWISRLHLPLFALWPLLLASLRRVARAEAPARGAGRARAGARPLRGREEPAAPAPGGPGAALA